MGIGSAIKKGLKKISKGLKKVINLPLAIAKKSWQEVKRAWNTKLGRALLIGAAIWATGGLLAMQFGGATGAVSGWAAFSPANVAAGFANAGSALASKLGFEGVASGLQTSGGAAVADAKAAAALYESTAPAEAILASSGAGAPVAAQTAAQKAAIAAAGGAGPAAGGGGGLLASAGQFATQNPLLTYGLLQTGGQMLAAANTPTQAEEYRDILRHTQRANDLSSFGPPPTPGNPSARFVTPNMPRPLTPPQPPAIPQPGLLRQPGGI